MVRDKEIELNHRKHRRSCSPSEEGDKSSKRHKHRHHHKHNRKHRHRHHRDKKHEEELQSGDDEIAAGKVSLSLVDPVGVSNGGEHDVEDGEILEEEILKKVLESDGESGEIQSGQFRDYNLPGTVPDNELADDRDFGGHVHQRNEEKIGKRSYVNGMKSFSSENSEEKHKISTLSPSNIKNTDEVCGQSISRSNEFERERSRSRVVVEDGFSVRENDGISSREALEGERSKERLMDREGGIKDKEGERSKHTESVRDHRREKEQEKRKEIEADCGRRLDKNRDHSKDRRRERERERSTDRDRRRERERDYVQDRDNVRGRSRDRTRYSSRERERGKDKERQSDKHRDKGREIQSDKEKFKSLDVGYGECRHKQSGNSRYDVEDVIRSSNSSKDHNSKGGTSKETWGNDKRSRNDNDHNDNDEVVWELPEDEEDELNRIKEESRKRSEAILEKYKIKSQQQNGLSSHDKGKDLELSSNPNQSSVAVVDARGSCSPKPVASAAVTPDNVGQAKSVFHIDAIDGDVSELSVTVGESLALRVTSDSDRTLAPSGLGEGSPKSERSEDMFRDDIFGESPDGNRKMGYLHGKGDGLPIVSSGLHDNWDDVEGYYSYQFGELLDGKFEIIATHGKGVFSTVVRAKDIKAQLSEPEEVAIKIIRNNETMHKAGQTEVQILKKLAGADPENKRHCVHFLSSFKYRNHLCLVFESLHLNLREVLKKFGRNIGLKLSAVRVYAKQLFIALKHLKNCGVLHCDIKPDNMLVNEGKNVLKLCDFGSAMFAGKNEITPYLVSRFYRAPEIILGLPYDHPLDIWSVGCCLYELYSGKVLFPGATNNDMLRLHMELKGPFPKKMLRKGAFIDQHFDQDLSFYATEEDSVTGKIMKRMIVNIKPKDFGSIVKGYLGEDTKMLAHFRDLLDKIFILDPEKRLTVSQALAHPFITGK